ncbi:MAG: glycosyltransferase, partial [Gammaproteobacteria bacterium]|nr:glycosyltransferase [Gammaproteobacteria bacterium]
MNILFLTIARFDGIDAHSIYTDLLRCFRNNGHSIFVIAPLHNSINKTDTVVKDTSTKVVYVPVGDATGSNKMLKKGLDQLLVEPKYMKAIKKHFNSIKFDLVLYSTPPITFSRVIEYVKKRDNAKTYLLLKDIFPQNAIDIGILSKKGLKGIIYKYFRNKEKALYRISDRIGCMSQANVDYVLKHNPKVSAKKVEVCPNSIEVIDKSVSLFCSRYLYQWHS